MSLRRPLAWIVAVSALRLAAAPPAAAADRRVEAAAKDALKKAANDYLATDYDAAANRLRRALLACGTSKCTVQTRAALLRDLGTMQFHNGDFGAARKAFADALRLEPDIKLNPDYDSADLRAAWREAGATAGTGPQPTGDFTHVAAAAQKANTPLPIYVEMPGGGNDVARVVVKYRSASMGDWARLELKKMGDGWGGQIPCADVTVGTMRYWVQGFGADGDPVASSGDPKRPFLVPIKNEITTEAPHFPGKAPPKSCEETDCPPGLPGCHTKEEEGGGGGEAEQTESEGEKGAAETAPYARIWVGASLAIDFLSVPRGTDLCRLDPMTAEPANSGNYYCTDPSGADFPAHNSAGGMLNSNLVPGEAGNVDGGIGIGNVRVMLSGDYAVLPNILAGLRFGYVFNAYTGSAAVSDGRAFGPKLHIEARGTYLYGREPLRRAGFVPMGFAGLGFSEFDWHATSIVAVKNVALQQPVNIWYTDAPFFFVLGGGVRYEFSTRTAFTGALRLNIAIGGNGVLPTFGPEIGVNYGF
jgi:hypothetical protein